MIYTPTVNCPSQETEVTSTPTRPVDNVVIATKGLQDRNTNIIAGTTVKNKGKLILTLDVNTTFSTGLVGVEVSSFSSLGHLTVGV